ncbi:MAG: hypothetical protein V1689_09360 [Pseudomonadota bacterium]
MMDAIKKVVYFAMDVANKPGEAARVLQALSEAGVSLFAFSGFPRGRRACRLPYATMYLCSDFLFRFIPKPGFVGMTSDRWRLLLMTNSREGLESRS